jgi:hypothetical protein
MLRGELKIVPCLIVLTAALACANSASAVVVASYVGPTVFDGIDDTVILPNVSIGLEGTVSLQFKADDTAGMHNIWYCADTLGGVLGEYRILLTNNTVWSELWPAGCSSGFGVDFHLTDTTSWHSVSLSWKDGCDIVMQFDGVEKRFPIAYEDGTPMSLPEFTTITGSHELGCSWHDDVPSRFFDGQMRNLVIYNTYETPEPSVFALTTTGALALFAYARWRRRQT